MLSEFLASYGYIALFFGVLAEGEVALIIAGFLIHQEYFTFPAVVALAVFTTYFADQFFFLLGRKRGALLLQRYPMLEEKRRFVMHFFEKYKNLFALLFRFFYGFRIISAFGLGMTSIRMRAFMLLDFVGTTAWALLMTGIGYVFGVTLVAILGKIKRFEKMILFILLVIAAGAWIVELLRFQRPSKK